jgi:hypothetical protein
MFQIPIVDRKNSFFTLNSRLLSLEAQNNVSKSNVIVAKKIDSDFFSNKIKVRESRQAKMNMILENSVNKVTDEITNLSQDVKLTNELIHKNIVTIEKEKTCVFKFEVLVHKADKIMQTLGLE